MSYLGIGDGVANHPLEVEGTVFVSNVNVPFEIYSDYTNIEVNSLTDSRQMRLRITPSDDINSTSHVDFGIDKKNNSFFITQPVFNTTVSGDRETFYIDNDVTKTVYHKKTTVDTEILRTNKLFFNNLTIDSITSNFTSNLYHTIYGGELIIETNSEPITLKIQSAVMGYPEDYFLLLTSEGSVWGAGTNVNGNLGIGKKIFSTPVFTPAVGAATSNVIQISAGSQHSAILKDDGTVYTTGDNQYGQLGINNNDNKYTFTQIPDITNAVKIEAGEYHTMVLTSEGTLYACGNNISGQLGNASVVNTTSSIVTTGEELGTTIIDVSCGQNHTMIIDSNYKLYGSGNNFFGELGIGNMDTQNTFTANSPFVTASNVICGYNYTLIIDGNNDVYSSGFNGNGELGIGNTDNQNTFTAIVPSLKASKVNCGYHHTLIIDENNHVYGSGSNGNGQLGIGNTDIQNTFTSNTSIVSGSIIACGATSSFVINENKLYLAGQLIYDPVLNYLNFTEYSVDIFVPDVYSSCFSTENYTQKFPSIRFGNNNATLNSYGIDLGYTSDPVIVDNRGIVYANAYVPFTGAHTGFTRNNIEPGLIVSVVSSEKLYVRSVNDVIPTLKLTDKNEDPNVYGVSSDGKTFNALGEGAIWVSDVNGPLSSGDYITSSTLSGYGKRQDDIYMENYTVGKILQNCDFNGDNVRYLSVSSDNSITTVSKDEYLTNTGSVYRASFVGCTYHCG